MSRASLLLMGVLSSAALCAAEVWHVERRGSSWAAVAPDGQATAVRGVEHIRWSGVRSGRRGFSPYEKNNEWKYASRRLWEERTLERLAAWKVNLLGLGSDFSLWRRGPAHLVMMSFGDAFAQNVSALIPHGAAKAGLPDVFDPAWESFCRHRAEADCIRRRGDRFQFGYFLDNELPWYPDWVCREVLKMPAARPARRALDALLAGGSLTDEKKVEFLQQVAERYFSVTTAALRAADPDHLILGCRFEGTEKMPDAIWKVAGRFCDVLSVNCYPQVDVATGDCWADKERTIPLLLRLTALSELADRPLMVSEWSFVARDGGLPCKLGGGQRFETQAERAAAVAFFRRALESHPRVVAHSWFMWTDAPADGTGVSWPEDCNYGLVNEFDAPYERVVESFVSD